MIDSEPRVATPSSGRCRPSRVLIVDDCDLNRHITAELLRAQGCLTGEARNGVEALSQVFAVPSRWDLVLIDLRMPTLNGFETVSLIRQREKELGLAAVSVVAVSASVCKSDERKALCAGCDAYLAKPLDMHALRSLLARFIGGERRLPVESSKGPAFEDTSPPEFLDMSSLAKGFLKSMHAHVTNMRCALDKNNIRDLVSLVHTTKGSSMLFGYANLTGVLCQLEDHAERLSDMSTPHIVRETLCLVDGLERELGKIEEKILPEGHVGRSLEESLTC